MSSYLKRLQENIQRLSVGLQDKEKRLKNKDFLKKAPAQVITQEREKAAEYKKAIERQKGLLRQLAPEIVV